MIEDFVRLIPESLMDKPGKAFYSGRDAFEPPKELYILGANPGGIPEYESETVRILDILRVNTGWPRVCCTCSRSSTLTLEKSLPAIWYSHGPGTSINSRMKSS